MTGGYKLGCCIRGGPVLERQRRLLHEGERPCRGRARHKRCRRRARRKCRWKEPERRRGRHQRRCQAHAPRQEKVRLVICYPCAVRLWMRAPAHLLSAWIEQQVFGASEGGCNLGMLAVSQGEDSCLILLCSSTEADLTSSPAKLWKRQRALVDGCEFPHGLCSHRAGRASSRT